MILPLTVPLKDSGSKPRASGDDPAIAGVNGETLR